jgi:hypothetical protein
MTGVPPSKVRVCRLPVEVEVAKTKDATTRGSSFVFALHFPALTLNKIVPLFEVPGQLLSLLT